MTEALVGLGIMMVLALLRIPIAISMGVVGFLGVAYLRDWNFSPAMAMVETKIYETGRNYTLSVIPLFILMGNFTTRAGMSKELFRAAYAFIGHLRGGLAMATICACAGFGAICGSSIATAATMAKSAGRTSRATASRSGRTSRPRSSDAHPGRGKSATGVAPMDATSRIACFTLTPGARRAIIRMWCPHSALWKGESGR